ncbi:multidrug transporter MatE [Kurthia sp. 3B1D]|uniref:Probable multidrug resistance protein NorM n=2 Tax=Candidatus Kurthia intestinigallinarum TaxID=1562256 RepID=A0A433RQB6_9BACL|nr:MATE family efflux transporter [Kurthia sp. 3B1D]RUS52599.1 multidrug transporter MatE [Kurthia sp. 3B1D]
MEKLQLEQYNTRKKKLRAILVMGIPAMFENILQTLVGFVDTLFVSKVSLDAVTAVSIANAIIAIYMAIFMAIGVGASSLIARYLGADNISKARQTAKQSTILALVSGILFGLATQFFAEHMLRVMGAGEAIVELGAVYLRIVGIPAFFISLTMVLASVIRATGNTTTPLKISFILNIIHIGLDYIFIIVLDGGVAGAAYATVLIRIVNSIWLYQAVQKTALRFSWRSPNDATLLQQLLALATPAALERLIMRVGQVVYFGLIIKIGADTYAAHMIAENIEAFTFMPGYGMAVVATTFVGASIGAKRMKEAFEYGVLSTVVTIVVMSVLGVLMFIFCPWMAHWFTDDPVVIDQIVTALRIDAFAQPAVAMSFVLAGALQGAGDTKTPMYATAVGMWGLRIVGVYVLGITLNMGIAGVWLALLIDLYVRSIFLWFQFRRKTLRGI